MPISPFSQLLAQILGTTPTFEGGPGGRPPTPMAPGAAYPEGGRPLPANPLAYPYYPGGFGFDLFPTPYGDYGLPRRPWDSRGGGPPGLYTPPARPLPWEQA